jgi:hypothetical protein
LLVNTKRKQVYYLNKQERRMAKKFNADKLKHERIAKHTSIGRRPKTSSMNKQELINLITHRVDESYYYYIVVFTDEWRN